MLTSPSPDSLGILLGLWGLAQSYFQVEDCVGFCICLSWGIPFAAVMPYNQPRTDSTVPGAAESSQQTGPALCTAAWAVVLAWPHAAEGKRRAHSGRQRRGCSSQCAGTEAGGGLNTGDFPRSEAEMEKEGKWSEKEELGKMHAPRKPWCRLEEAAH